MPTDSETRDGTERRPGDPENPEVVSTLEDEAQAGAHLGIQAEIEVPGDPDILPGTMVKLVGLGRRFEGHAYAVHKVVHSIGLGGFSTTLTLVTNMDALMSQLAGGVPATGPTNTAEPQTGGDAVTATSAGGAGE